jgi:hypothetical protein
MISGKSFWMTMLVTLGILIGYSMGFSQLTPANPNSVVSIANNWLHLSQEMGWGWMDASDFTVNSIQNIEYQGELLAFCLPVSGGGYIVIPACRELPPITAYSPTSTLDVTKDEGFCGMLKEVLTYKTNLVRDYLANSNPPPEAAALQEEIDHDGAMWQAYTSNYSTFTKALEQEDHLNRMDSEPEMEGRYGILSVNPLLGSISWHQFSPYNNFCPNGDGGRCVAGCGAIAMAQVMKFWNYPPNGVGSHSYYWNGDQSCGGSTSGQTLSATFSDSYDWSNILPHYSGSETQTQKDAVAELCYEAGVGLNMDYGVCGSGSYLSAVPYAFTHYFSYSSSINTQSRSSYTAATWFAMLQTELNYNRPLCYYISDHLLNCDGWRVSGTNQIHMNYGWDDGHNAWYTVDNLYCDWSGCNPMIEQAVRQIIGTPFVNISMPNGGETLYISRSYDISWSAGGFSGNVTISLKRNYPSGSWETLFSGTANDGAETWTVTGAEATNARIRIISDSNPSIGDTSDANFQILTPHIQVYAPNGGEIWCVGDTRNITWNPGVSPTVTISINRNYPSGGWETLFSNTSDDGTEPWPVAGATTSNARIRIVSDSAPIEGDTSDANFTVSSPYIVVTSPNGGESWYVSETRTIYWAWCGVNGNVDISINRNYPSGGWETILSGTPNDGSQQWTVTEPISSNARIRIVSASNPSVRDSSDANFTILSRYIAITAPNGGEIWHVGDTEDITWGSVNISGTVTIMINYSYPGGPWQSIVSNTPNDGVHPWQVTLPTTTNARIRVISDSYSNVGDTSAANFTITDQAVITLTSPNGGELCFVGDPENITWTSGGVSGNIEIELNRNYPGGSWETLFASTANDGTEPWTVTSPVTSNARIRVSSVSQPTVNDVSDANFTIEQDNPPVILHDPKGDGEPGYYILFVARVFDELPGPTVTLFCRALGAVTYDSTDMEPTGNPDEYSATLSLVGEGSYQYYIKAVDASQQVSETPVYAFRLYNSCGSTIAYDDGSADRFNWGGAEEFRWAVKFTPEAFPFNLCGAEVAISGSRPDSAHTPFRLEVYSESGGWPGTLLFTDTTGSIGNVIGGLPPGETHWADAVIRNGSGEPLALYGDFFIAVSNPDTLFYEAFARDTTSASSGRSFLYDGCLFQWFNENDGCDNCKPGNRMIRALGYYQLSPTVVVYRSGDDAELHWTPTGAPYYRIYSDTAPFGSYATLEGSTSDTLFFDTGAMTNGTRMFYRVTSSTLP